METRKIQFTGGSTYTVSLPKEWAERIDFDPGDGVELYDCGRTLALEPAVDDADRWHRSVDLSNTTPERIRRTVKALYTAGYDRVDLSIGGEEETRRGINAAARKYIGLESLDRSRRSVTLETLLDSRTVSVEQSIVQLSQVALSMNEDAIRAVIEGDEDLADRVSDRDDQADRLYAMIDRHFQRSLVTHREAEELSLSRADLYAFQSTARQLERVADHAERISSLVEQFESGPNEDLAASLDRFGRSVRDVVDRATKAAVGDADQSVAHRALDDRDAVTADLESVQRDVHDREHRDGHLLTLVLQSLTRTAEYGGNVAERAIQHSMRPGDGGHETDSSDR